MKKYFAHITKIGLTRNGFCSGMKFGRVSNGLPPPGGEQEMLCLTEQRLYFFTSYNNTKFQRSRRRRFETGKIADLSTEILSDEVNFQLLSK